MCEMVVFRMYDHLCVLKLFQGNRTPIDPETDGASVPLAQARLLPQLGWRWIGSRHAGCSAFGRVKPIGRSSASCEVRRSHPQGSNKDLAVQGHTHFPA